MDIHETRRQLRTRTIYDIPLRVTYYARVSSESDEQLNSLGNQIAYYENFIKKNPAWIFVSGYIDEGLSGISTKKRENFNRMVADAKNGAFDLIITKEISRFARNTLDSLRYTRELLGYGVCVFFQNDNINTVDEDSELRLSIMSSIAQDELRKLSSRVKFGHQQAIKSSVVLGNSRIFGYEKREKRLVVNEEEAKMVRELFSFYATDQYSMKQIEQIFWQKGYRNHNGNKIAHTTMSGIISNPKYKGYYVGNKVRVVDMFTKKQKFLPPEEWVMFKDETGEIVPAIVPEELWDRANEILRRRSEDVKNRQGVCNHANLLTGKLFCACCGRAYYRRESRDRHGKINSRWVCSGKINNGAESCPSFPIYEDDIKPILFDAFRDTEADAEALIAEYTDLYREMMSDGDLQKQMDDLRARADLAQKKKAKLLEYNVCGRISDDDFVNMNRQADAERKEAEAALKELELKQFSKNDFKRHMDEVRETLRRAQADARDGMVTNEFVETYIDRILVTPVNEREARLDIKIFTGSACEKRLRRLAERAKRSAENPLPEPSVAAFADAGRAGHMFKKMIESYENNNLSK